MLADSAASNGEGARGDSSIKQDDEQ